MKHLVWMTATLLTACNAARSGPKGFEVEQGPRAAVSVGGHDEAAVASPTANDPPGGGRPIVLLTDSATLVALERGGLSAGPIAFGAGDETLASFAETPRMKAIRDVIQRDVKEEQAADPRAGVGMRSSHRLFDVSWLTSAKTRLELVGVSNRADRQPFAPEHCGETRLVYRLAYRTERGGETIDSRLPMTVNVVFWQDADDCARAAKRWMVPADLGGSALGRWLVRDEGPLGPSQLSTVHLKSIEINLQILRWPAVVHPSLGGHAAYVLRVFEPDGSSLKPAPLENTPDVRRLSSNAKARSELLAWLRDPTNLEALDQGIAVIPDRFTATKSISVTPRGLGRLANRPFSQLLRPSDFADLELQGRAHIGSPEALLRRLDGSSCQGCHETRSVAGFHLLGSPRDPDAVIDTLLLPTSPHLDGDLARRERWVAAMARGERADPSRPLSDFERVAGGYGAHCGLGDPGLTRWTCGEGLHCVAMDDPQMGTCLPVDGRGAGDPCERGTLRTRTDPVADRIRGVELLVCDDGAVCNRSAVGFPAGMCTKGCDELDDGEACGTIVNLRSFNDCLVQRQPFAACIAQAGFPAGMRGCDATHRCREDYICARSPAEPGQGVCLPPYFLFQMRVDGHVL